VTMYHAMAIRINRCLQDAEDNLQQFIDDFDIRKFDNENVDLAKLLLTAGARALGDSRLKSNAPRKVLEGMARCSTEPFQLMVASILSLHSMASFRATLPRSTLAILLALLSNLSIRYNELLQGHLWNGVGHDGSAFVLEREPPAMPTSTLTKDELEVFFVEQVRVYKATGQRLPFSQWVKDKECNNCGKLGHIKRDCPLLKGGRRSQFNRHRSRGPNRGRSNTTKDDDKSDKTKEKDQKAGRKSFNRTKREFANALLAEADADASASDDSSASSSDESNDQDHTAMTANMGLNAMLASLKE